MEHGEEFAADGIAFRIVRSEIALAVTAHGGRAAVEETFVDRDRSRLVRPAVIERMHETGARSKREKRLLKPALQRRKRLIFHHAGRERFRTERQKIAEANRAARQLDFAAEHGRGEIECRVSNKAARRDQWTVAQIERLSKTKRVNEVRGLTEKLVVDRGAGDLDVTCGEN